MPTLHEENLVAALDNNIDQYNVLLTHSSTTTSSLDNTLRAMPSLRVNMGIAGVMELGRRRDLYMKRVEARGRGQGHTLADGTVCADQLEEHVASSGTNKFNNDKMEPNLLLLMTKYWTYRQREIQGQQRQLWRRWSRYCRTSGMIARTQQEFQQTLCRLSDEYDRHCARVLRVERNSNPPLPKELEQYATWLLRRQQCNEGLKRFYVHVQWLPCSHRGDLVLNVQRLVQQQRAVSHRTRDGRRRRRTGKVEVEEEEEEEEEWEEDCVMTNAVRSVEQIVARLLSEYYRGGAGQQVITPRW